MRMKKILVVMGTYLPRPSANGICLKGIIDILKEQGDEVIVLTSNLHNYPFYEEIDNTKIYRIKDKFIYTDKFNSKNVFFKKIFKLIDKISSLFKLLVYYNVSLTRKRRYTLKADELMKEYKFDMVISVVRPAETLYVLKFLKKNYPEIKTVSYNLDILNDINISKFINPLYQVKTIRFYRRISLYIDAIINLNYSKEYFLSSFYKNLHNKMYFVDIPTFHQIKSEYEIKDWKDNTINIVFTGMLSETIRNPETILKCFFYLRDIDFVLHFYSRGCEDILNEVKKQLGNKIELHGFVPTEVSYAAIKKADYLLNISNKTNYQVPSKIFEYFASGKPLINYIYSDNDPAMKYYNQYDNRIDICSGNNIEQESKKLRMFLFNKRKKSMTYKELEEIYYENTPKCLVDILNNCLKEEKMEQNYNE